MSARDGASRVANWDAIATAASFAIGAVSFVVCLIVGYSLTSFGVTGMWPHIAAMGMAVLTFTAASKLADAWIDSRKAKAGERS